MNTNLEKVIKSTNEPRTPDALRANILLRIDHEQVKRMKLRMIVTRTVGGLSFVAFFPIFVNLINQLQNSGFWNYLSLLFTDTGTVAMYWQEFSLSLIDALPLFQLSLTLVSLLVLSVSLKFAAKDIKKVSLLANYI